MEYCAGGDLGAKIKKRKLHNDYFDEAQLLRWLSEILLALKYLHKRGILHRDIKCGNLFLTVHCFHVDSLTKLTGKRCRQA